jgi:dTDP-4-dehydrorhamnose 3,5-epimerase
MHHSDTGPVLSSSRLMAGHAIDGVDLRVLDTRRDHRGSFTEVFQEHWNTCITPVQWSVVHSQPRVFRGVHLHRRHDEYFGVILGRAFVGLRDVRPWSATRGAWALYELVGDDPACLTFPLGLLHGWYFSEETIHLQAVSEAYRDYADDDNWGCVWSDPALEIPWPFAGEPVVTTRVRDFPTMAALLEALGEWAPPRRGDHDPQP